MKNLYSMSGLLPAQFRNDPASAGIGWTTINPKRRPFMGIDVAKPLDETVPASEQAKPTPTDATDANDSTINVGDWVQVLPDYDGCCGEKLNPGGIYVVRKINGISAFKLSNRLGDSWIGRPWIRKIDLKVGMRVETLGKVKPPYSSDPVSGIGKITDMDTYDDLLYRVHVDGKNSPLWFEEGTITLCDGQLTTTFGRALRSNEA